MESKPFLQCFYPKFELIEEGSSTFIQDSTLRNYLPFIVFKAWLAVYDAFEVTSTLESLPLRTDIYLQNLTSENIP